MMSVERQEAAEMWRNIIRQYVGGQCVQECVYIHGEPVDTGGECKD